MKTDPNETAYPHICPVISVSAEGVFTPLSTSGLTKRELFAALAMQGILSNPKYTGELLVKAAEFKGEAISEFVSNMAVGIASNLIAALNKPQ